MEIEEKELLMRAKQGDTFAFERLVYQYDRHVLSIALRFVNDLDTAKDIYQEVFIRVFKGLKKFEFRSEFSTWIFRITTNVCLSYKVRNKDKMNVSLFKEQKHEDDDFSYKEIVDHENTPEEDTTRKNLAEFINKAVDDLSERQKITFILKHYEGYKIREIAEILNCKEGTVKKNLYDAVKNLKDKLKPLVAYQI